MASSLLFGHNLKVTVQKTSFDKKWTLVKFLFALLLILFCCLVTKSSETLCDPMDCSTPGLLIFHYLPEFAQTHVHWVGDTIQPSHPLLSPSLPAISLSRHQGLFQWVGSSHQVEKNRSFSISSSNGYSGSISFRMDRFALLAVQGTLKSLLQHHSLKASIL